MLAGYKIGLGDSRGISRTPLSITALPTWLERSGFKGLASSAGSYVLQVHSLERPKDINTRFELCDSKAARRAVDLAGKVGVPFRVALPTYGYLIAFDSEGKYWAVGEGPSGWPVLFKARNCGNLENGGLVAIGHERRRRCRVSSGIG